MPQATMNQYPDAYDGPLPRCVITQQALFGYEYRYRFVLEKVVLDPGAADPKTSREILFQGSIAEPAPGVAKTPCGYVFALNVVTERTPIVTAKAGDEVTMAGKVVPAENDPLAVWTILAKDGRLLYAAIDNPGVPIDKSLLGGFELTLRATDYCLTPTGPGGASIAINAAGEATCLFDLGTGGCCSLWKHDYLAYLLSSARPEGASTGSYAVQVMDRDFLSY